jgi:hypothetical protein
MVTDPLALKLLQLPSFLKWLRDNDLTTKHTQATEEDRKRSPFSIFSVNSVGSVVNALEIAVE